MKKMFKIALSVLLILTTISFAQDGAMDKEAAKLYNQGNKQKKSGDYDGALASYTEALNKSKDYRIYYQLSSVYKKKRDFAKSEEMLNKALELNPKFNIAHNALGTTYYSWGKYEKAIESFKKYAENATKKKDKKRAKKYIGLAYTKLGDIALKEKKYDKALEYLMNAVSNYNYDAAYLKLADIYLDKGQYNEALQAADNAVKYKSRKSKVPKGAPYFYKGMAYKGLHNIAKAKENFKKASKDKRYRDRSKHEIKYLK